MTTTGRELTHAYEENIAEWWEAQICASGSIPDRKRGLHWIFDRDGGASGIHNVRLTEANAADTLERCLDEAALYGPAEGRCGGGHIGPAKRPDEYKAYTRRH